MFVYVLLDLERVDFVTDFGRPGLCYVTHASRMLEVELVMASSGLRSSGAAEYLCSLRRRGGQAEWKVGGVRVAGLPQVASAVRV